MRRSEERTPAIAAGFRWDPIRRRYCTGDPVLPLWGERPLAGITKADVVELVNDKAARRERKRQRHRARCFPAQKEA